MDSYIGNDIVDLTLPGALEKYKDRRFVERVLAESELRELEKSEQPDRLLWIFWSAKEAAYKALKKAFPEIKFSSKKFVVDLRSKQLRYHDKLVYLSWLESDSWVYCSGVYGNPVTMKNRIQKTDSISCSLEDFSDEELISIHSQESAAVRALAKKLLKDHSFDKTQIIRKKLDHKFAPPKVFIENRPVNGVDLSLTHDGNFVGASTYFQRVHQL